MLNFLSSKEIYKLCSLFSEILYWVNFKLLYICTCYFFYFTDNISPLGTGNMPSGEQFYKAQNEITWVLLYCHRVDTQISKFCAIFKCYIQQFCYYFYQWEVFRVNPDNAKFGVIGIVLCNILDDLQKLITICLKKKKNIS